MNRRDWLKSALVGTAGLTVAKAQPPGTTPTEPDSVEPIESAAPQNIEEIHRLLGFATRTGEDPLTLWARLRETREWLVGPLSPDGWAGQAFVADHADIFAFRFLSLPAAWTQGVGLGKLAVLARQHLATWFAKWSAWWRQVGPRAPDDSYARLGWQMPGGGPEVTYEWARQAPSEDACRITNSLPSDVLLEAYVPWDPAFAVLYSDSPDRKFLRGRPWVPGTRDGMRWVLATSSPIEESMVIGTAPYYGLIRGVHKLYLCVPQGQTY